MKKRKLMLTVLVAAIMVLGLATVSFAASEGLRPAEILANLTGEDVEDIEAGKEAGDGYGALAQEKGVFEAFKADRLVQAESQLEAAVTDGRLTQEEADERLSAMQEKLENCDGTCDGSGTGGLRIGRNGGGNGTGNGSQSQNRQGGRQMNCVNQP